MSGINLVTSKKLVCDKNSFITELQRFCFGNLDIKSEYSHHNILASLLSTSTSEGNYAYDKKRKIYAIVDGYFVNCLNEHGSSAAYLLSYYCKYGDALFTKLNGSYNILLIDENSSEITVISDRYGTRPLFYADTQDCIAVSPFAKFITQCGVLKKELDLSAVANHLSYSRVQLGNSTFFKGIRSFPSSSIMRGKVGFGWSISTYDFEAKKDEIPENEAIEKLACTFKDVIKDFNQVDKIGLSLSGGLDSRILLAAGFKGKTFTWGYQEANDEIKLAKQSANVTDNDWEFITVTPESFLDENGIGDQFREGLDLSVQSYALDVYPAVKAHGINGLMTGLALDFTMASSYLPYAPEESNEENFLDFVFSKAETFKLDERNKLINSKEVKAEIDLLTFDIKQKITGNTQESITQSVVSFFMDSRVRRCIFHRQQWQRAFVEDYIPTFDNRLIDSLSHFNSVELQGHTIFQKVLAQLNNNLLKVPYQGTMLPANVPVKYWQEGTRIEQEKEKLYRKIYAESNGTVFIPYNRYYSNFDEWLRMNPSWKTYTRSLLLSDDTQLSELLNMDVLKNWIELQENGKGNYFSKIIQIMSLEKTLRAHFA